MFAALAAQADERVADLLGHRIGEDPAGDVRELRELVAQQLITDVIMQGGDRYGGFLPRTGRIEVIRQIETADTLDDAVGALALMAAADLLERPVTVTGLDRSSSESYGLEYGGAPVEFLLLPGGDGRYLPVGPGGRTGRWQVGTVLSGTFSGPVFPADLSLGVETASGLFFPARDADGVPDDGVEEWLAAGRFPVVIGATVVHVHSRPGGRVVVGNRLLTVAQFAEVLVARGVPTGRPVILVTCGGGVAGSLAAELAVLGRWPVVAATTEVFTDRDGEVLAAPAGFATDGTPLPAQVQAEGRPAPEWTLSLPPEAAGPAGPTELGSPVLFDVLCSGVLNEYLGLPPGLGPVMDREPGRIQPGRTRRVWWSAPGSSRVPRPARAPIAEPVVAPLSGPLNLDAGQRRALPERGPAGTPSQGNNDAIMRALLAAVRAESGDDGPPLDPAAVRRWLVRSLEAELGRSETGSMWDWLNGPALDFYASLLSAAYQERGLGPRSAEQNQDRT
jgi:hypothetical protein